MTQHSKAPGASGGTMAGKRPVEKGMVTHRLMMIAFGIGTLGFCIAIDHPGWFHIRPISGTAAAMARASSGSAAEVPAHASTSPVKPAAKVQTFD